MAEGACLKTTLGGCGKTRRAVGLSTVGKLLPTKGEELRAGTEQIQDRKHEGQKVISPEESADWSKDGLSTIRQSQKSGSGQILTWWPRAPLSTGSIKAGVPNRMQATRQRPRTPHIPALLA